MSDLWDDRKLYDDRDPTEQGDWFIRHMHHLTTENLHSKAEIAEELAHRDIEIERLRSELASCIDALDRISMIPDRGTDRKTLVSVVALARSELSKHGR